MDETPPIGATMHVNSQAASWYNLCYSACVEILVWPYIWNTMYVKLHVKMYIFSRKFNTNFYLRQTCENIFKLAVKTNHYTTVCVPPAELAHLVYIHVRSKLQATTTLHGFLTCGHILNKLCVSLFWLDNHTPNI